MKKVLAVLVFVTMSLQAFAMVDPSWERPIVSSEEMMIVEVAGQLASYDGANLVINKRDDAADYTSVSINLYSLYHHVPLIDVSTEITHIERTGCGDKYMGHVTSNWPDSFEYAFIITDYSEANCMIAMDYIVELEIVQLLSCSIVGRAHYVGNLSPVFTIL